MLPTRAVLSPASAAIGAGSEAVEEREMGSGRGRVVAIIFGLLTLLVAHAAPAAAQDTGIGYFGTNTLVFAPVGILSPPEATGKGIIDYQGGDEPKSQWRATFRFSNLSANTDYVVMVKGRSGDPGSLDAGALTPLCSFQTDENGKGNCFWFFRGLARLNVVQLRTDDDENRRVMQASRDGDPGSITTDPNRYSPGGVVPERKRQSTAATK
jgi:hypothetical protein